MELPRKTDLPDVEMGSGRMSSTPDCASSTHTLEELVVNKHTPANEVFKDLYRSRCKLFFAFILGVSALYVENSAKLRQQLLGDSAGTHSAIWWFACIPVYVAMGIYFLRFFGAYLIRVWVMDVCSSKVVQQSAVTFAAGILEDERLPHVINSALSQDGLVAGLSHIAAGVVRSAELRRALAHTTRHAALEAATSLDRHATADASRELEKGALEVALARQATALFGRYRTEISSAVAGVMHDVLREETLTDEFDKKLKKTLAGTVADPALYRGIKEGISKSASPFWCSEPKREISDGALDLVANSV
jgi:hypothetical protein